MLRNLLAGMLLLCLSFSFVHAGTDTAQGVSWGFLIMVLLGGLALFLYGMAKMSAGLKKVAGDGMRNILASLTGNRILAVFIGAFVTMVIQSSSATTVMLVSFVQAQLMSFAASISVILGANIGTTVTAQLIAFKLTDYALLLVAAGFFMTMFSKQDKLRYIGEVLLGFGILFYGMKLMSDAMRPLRSYEPFIQGLVRLENPLLGLMAGAVFTALVQSSSALTGIVIVLSQQGVLSLEAGIPLILGANVGTCVTAGLASIGASREAKRVAIAHVVFNITGAFVFLFLVPQLAELVRSISPQSSLTGIDKLAAETPRQIANAHTIFNITVALLFIPFTGALAALIFKIFPEKDIEQGIAPKTKYINDVALETPSMALDLAREEVGRMTRLLSKMLSSVIRPFIGVEAERDERKPELTFLEGLEMRDGKIDFLEKRLSAFLIKLSSSEITEDQANEVFVLTSVVDHLETMGDIIIRSILPLVDKKRKHESDFSEQGKEELLAYHSKVMNQLSRLDSAFSEMDPGIARKIMKKQVKYEDLEAKYRKAHLGRLLDDQSTLKIHEIHLELLDSLRQINVYAGTVARYISELVDEEA